MTNGFMDMIGKYWPALADGAVTFAFPFISEIRKDWIHPNPATGTISNILAGIAAAAILLLLTLNRNSIHLITAALPQWYYLVLIGILLLFGHQLIGLATRRSGGAQSGPMRSGSVVFYVLAIVALTFGFNLPILRTLVYIPVGGAANCIDVSSVYLTTAQDDASSRIADSPIDQQSYKYEFLLLPEEKGRGLFVTVKDQDSRIVDANNEPQYELDLCSGP